ADHAAIAIRVRIFVHRSGLDPVEDSRPLPSGRPFEEGHGPFAIAPRVIAAGSGDKHRFASVLPDIRADHGWAVEVEPMWIPQPNRPELFERARHSDEGVVIRDAVTLRAPGLRLLSERMTQARAAVQIESENPGK